MIVYKVRNTICGGYLSQPDTPLQLFGNEVPVGGNSPLKQSILVTNFLTLTYKQSMFSFEFSALSYASPQRNRYRYRLERLDDKWNETDSSRHFVTYTTLAPGEYVFRVQGSNNRGVWNERGVSVRVRILPPWWSTWWFRTTFAALILVLLWALYQLRIRQLQQQERPFRPWPSWLGPTARARSSTGAGWSIRG